MDIVEVMDVNSRLKDYRKSPVTKPKIYAFYLPQYHQIPENDEFWGEGFTDWVNVKKAKPLFEGHRQPILPSEEVGFYDLKDPEVLRKQAKMAKDHGIDGFIFHHYWFDGKKVLDTPINNWLNDPTIDLPLAICWANEPWTRTWDGLNNNILIPQSYGDDWAIRFWDDASPFLQDARYIRVDGAPLLLIYSLCDVPDLKSALTVWRDRAKADGHPDVHILGVAPPRESGTVAEEAIELLDGIVNFPPRNDINIESLLKHVRATVPIRGDFMSYECATKGSPNSRAWSVPVHSGLIPNWDNTARRGSDAYGFIGSNPISWAGGLREIKAKEGTHVFVNAWNEWAESAVLEGDQRFLGGFSRSIKDLSAAGMRR